MDVTKSIEHHERSFSDCWQHSEKYNSLIGGTMSTVAIPSPIHRELELLGQTVVVIGGSAGIGFETARRAHAEGAKVILTGRNADRLQHAASLPDPVLQWDR